jgi:2-polyprenyl-6-methoxyphenol hydroxylase-like FAD-dependent oxidoreductase
MPEPGLVTTCCIVGGGPAGLMLGYLLARAGVRVTVLEKHNDFFRDFRGDTVHPSTLEVFNELGLLDALLQRPHQRLGSVRGVFGDFPFEAARFRHLPVRCRFIALMPQWEFLNFLSGETRKFPSFDLRMGHQVTGLQLENGRVAGVEAKTPEGTISIRANLVVGCDGRHSVTRHAGKLELIESGVPIDVLWFRVSRRDSDPNEVFGNINFGKVLVLINRGDYFQAGLMVEKGSFDAIRQRGIDDFRQAILKIAPYLGERVHELHDWDQVKLLTVRIDRLRRWHRPGLLCIGDAAHAMSPAGGVGINLAIQDAVATANLLGEALRDGSPVDALLERVQCRREFPTRVTQFAQKNAHNLFAGIFRQPGQATPPWQLKAAVRIPGIPDLFGRFIGMGVRPEHVGKRKGLNKKLLVLGAAAAAAVALAIASRRRFAAS